jgi:signal transduction histidine kinase
VLDAQDRPGVNSGREQTVQMIRNLISNAIKYSGPGTRMAVTGRPDTAEAIVTVTDLGSGISTAEQRRRSLPFARLEGTWRISDTGLGRCISHAIVEAHGGEIEVVSRAGRAAPPRSGFQCARM